MIVKTPVIKDCANKESDTLALTTRILISRIKKHLERDDCQHCRAVLREDNEEAGKQPALADDISNSNPDGKEGVVFNNEYDKRR